MRKFVLAAAAVGALAGLMFGPTAASAATYAYVGVDPTIWNLSFNFSLPGPVTQDIDPVVPCTDNHGDTGCILTLYLAGTPAYLNPLSRISYNADPDHDLIGVSATGGLGGGTAFGCCIGFAIVVDAGALNRNGVYKDLYYGGDLTVSGVPAASAAPEPAGWALMILGFGGAGAALRRRRLEQAQVQPAAVLT